MNTNDFSVQNLWWIRQGVLTRPASTALVECIRNSWQADAKEIVVFADPKTGMTAIADNGRGMSEHDFMVLLKGIGRSDKIGGPRGSKGIALKIIAPILNERGVEVISHKKGSQTRVVLGRTEFDKSHHQVMYGFVESPAPYSKKVTVQPLGVLGSTNWPTGTVVVLRDLRFEPDTIVRLLNNAFGRIPKGVKVSVHRGASATQITGRYALMDSCCSKVGTFEVRGANVRWGIIKEDLSKTLRDDLNKIHVAVMFNDELVEMKSRPLPRGGNAILNTLGVLPAGQKLLFIIEALDYTSEGEEHLAIPTYDRADLEKDWEFYEVLESIATEMPDDVREFVDQEMEANTADGFEPGKLTERLHKQLIALGLYSIRPIGEGKGGASRPHGDPNPNSPTREARERNPHPKPKVDSLPVPVWPEDTSALEGRPFLPGRWQKLTFNKDFPPYQAAIDLCKKPAERTAVMDHWMVHCAHGWAQYLSFYEANPSDEAIFGIAAAWIPDCLPTTRLKEWAKVGRRKKG